MLIHNNLYHEIIIAGAGIAGIAASKMLTEKAIPHMILEASDQLGGRARRAPNNFGSWFDLGCSYLHEGEINPFVKISESLNIPVKKNLGDMFSLEKTKFLFNGFPFSEKTRESIIEADYLHKKKISQAQFLPKDRVLSSYFHMDSPHYPIFENLLMGLNGTEANQVSAKDFASVKEGQDYVIETGMTNLIEKWASDLNIKFNSPINEVFWLGKQVFIQTKDTVFRTKKLLITVSNGILGANKIKFSPKLPNYKIAAIRKLPMGNLNKVGILFKDNTFRGIDEGWYVACSGPSEKEISSVMSFEIRQKPKNHMIIFFGGQESKELELSPEKTFSKIRKMLSQTFGPALEERTTSFIHSSWASDRYSMGSYSFALPGYDKKRDLLRKPLDNKLFFAGEATSKEHYGTCHGAYLSGVRAAKEIISQLNS